MKIVLAADHAGYLLKEEIKKYLLELDHEIEDVGAHTLESGDDYPDFMIPAARMVSEGKVERGIFFGGSGQGESMVANRFPGVRAVVYYGGSDDIIRLSREHNDANVLSLGARFLELAETKQMIERWLSTAFSGEERHARRIQKMNELSV